MYKTRASIAAMCAGLSVAIVSAHQQAGPKLTADEIFEYQNRQQAAGSAEAGRPIFEKRCAMCHRFGELGQEVGPDLTTIASRFKKKDVLESILWPSKVISEQYQSEMFELKDGSTVSGVPVRESAAAVFVRTSDSPERPVQILKDKIATRTTSTVSLMTEGLLDGLTQADIANLLAFMLSPQK
jgi:putative heme-binding domain-containing protein